MTIELVLLPTVAYRGQEITRPRVRDLLALLAGEPRAGLGQAALARRLWTDRRPEDETRALRVLVSQTRSALGAGLIVNTPGGYRLGLPADRIDTAVLAAARATATRLAAAGDHAGALAEATHGLALWDGAGAQPGDALGDLRTASVPAHRSLRRVRALALARLGRHPEALAALPGVLDEQPGDEEVLAELLVAEAATTGPAAALGRYDRHRRALRDRLGTEPGPALRELHDTLLSQDRPPVRHGVEHDPNPLLGRDADLAAVAGLLRTSRVTSIVGAGGLGKTRLAHAVSRRADQRVVHVVSLAGLAPGGDVTGHVASTLGVGEPAVGRAHPASTGPGVVGAIAGAVGAGPVLLVLDNCEHVIAGVAGLVRALVSLCGELRVLTTSRSPLGLSSESVYLLPELGLATAVELFGQRALAARPDLALPPDAVRALCAQLDGLPLAIELAAARVRVMSVAEIAAGLRDRFGLLRGGPRDAPRRHRTLHAVIDWSWALLTPDGRAAMRTLSAFPDGFTADAASAVLDGDVVAVLEQLVDQSLLTVSGTPTGTRFRMLETVREFSAAHRDQAGETDAVTDRFLLWAKDFVLTSHDPVLTADPLPAIGRLRAEQDNLWHALRLALDRAHGPTVAAVSAVLATLCTIDSNLVRMSGLVGEIGAALARYRPPPPMVEVTRTAAVLTTVNSLLLHGPRATRALVALRRLPRPTPDTLIRAADLVLLAAATPSQDALDALCDSENPLVAGLAGNVASYVWENAGDLDRALACARAMVAAAERAANPWLEALARSRLGELCLQADLGDQAREHLRAGLTVVERLGALASATRVRWALVLASLQCGAVDEAEFWLERAVPGGDDDTGLGVLDVAVRAEIHLARGDVDAGLRLWRRATDRLGRDSALPLALEARAVAVVAHAHHGRLDLVADLVAGLPGALSAVLTSPVVRSGASFVDFPVAGALLLGIAMADLDTERTGPAVRMIALAERFRCVRGFQPTMSAAHARRLAGRADGPAFCRAVEDYADLRGEALRTAALAALADRSDGGLAVEQRPGPQVAAQCDGHAPADRH